MPTIKFGRAQRAAAFLPIAVLSTAWTAAIAGVGPGVVTVNDAETGLPEGTTVPEQAIEAPASITPSENLGLGVKGNTEQIVAESSTNGIPAAALAAYQRAESVINRADKACNLTWQLVAAIGRVESNHGRAQGNTLDDNGVARPGIYGIALNGKNGTKSIQDTDAGQFDRDTVWDRAVGPMQFIPGTWSTVGVDADSDGQRDPQDIDDSALASAVYLCSGNDDLATVAGQRAAVFRYNNSQSYVSLVLQIMNAYLEGDFTQVPNGTVSAGPIAPLPNFPTGGVGNGGNGGGNGNGNNNFGNGTGGNGTGTGGTNNENDGTPGGTGGNDNENEGGNDGNTPPPSNPPPPTTTPPSPSEPVEKLIDGILGPVKTLNEAIQKCNTFYPPLQQPLANLRCLTSYGAEN